MNLTFKTQTEAQVVADRIFADMNKAGALEPGTVCWAIPTREADEKGNAFGPWLVEVDVRCKEYLTEQEIDSVPEWYAEKIARSLFEGLL